MVKHKKVLVKNWRISLSDINRVSFLMVAHWFRFRIISVVAQLLYHKSAGTKRREPNARDNQERSLIAMMPGWVKTDMGGDSAPTGDWKQCSRNRKNDFKSSRKQRVSRCRLQNCKYSLVTPEKYIVFSLRKRVFFNN
jgi:hypothetical protein